MKKLSVLLVAAAVALAASAGLNNKIINTNETKVNITELKGQVMNHGTKYLRGSSKAIASTPVKVMDWNIRPAANVLRDGNNYLWDFEDEAQVADWSVIDNDGDGYCWEYINNADFNTHSGSGCMSSASYDNPTYTALTPDNWLVSPIVTLNGSLQFYAAGQDASWASEVFAVYVCVGEPTDINSFVKISEDITATGTMTAYTYDLADYAGQEGCIAIRHYNVTDMFRLNIDDVTIGEVQDPGDDPDPTVPTVITDIPDGCTLKTFYRNSDVIYASIFGIGGGATDGKFTIAFAEDGKVYVQNPTWYYDTNDAWVEGTFDEATGIISIPTGQFLSYYADYGYGIQLVWGSTYTYEEEDPDTGEMGTYLGVEIDDRTTEIQMRIDGDQVYLIGTEGDINAEFPSNYNATGMMTIYNDDQSFTSLEFNDGVEVFGYTVNIVPAVPAAPVVTEWYDCGDESGFSRLYFTLPNTDVDGNMIDPEFLSYAVWVNDGFGNEYQFTFDAASYTYDLTEDITEVPYELYSSAVDFSASGVYFYRTNAEGYEPLFTYDLANNIYGNIGVLAFYTVDGVRNASEIGWLYDIDTSVSDVTAGKTVANVRYFNVAGQEMAQPEGLTIKVITYTDGTSNTVKVVK